MAEDAIAALLRSGSRRFEVSQAHREDGPTKLTDGHEKSFPMPSAAGVGVSNVHVRDKFFL
jgi:hypothetical protein